MTWLQLLEILENWRKLGHTSMNKPVEFLEWSDGGSYAVTVMENLVTGNAYLVTSIEEEDDQPKS